MQNRVLDKFPYFSMHQPTENFLPKIENVDRCSKKVISQKYYIFTLQKV